MEERDEQVQGVAEAGAGYEPPAIVALGNVAELTQIISSSIDK